jgi:hypothetical protein
MTVPHPSPSPRRVLARAGLAAVLLGLVCLANFRGARTVEAADPTAPGGGKPKETLVGGLPLFGTWPADQKPDAVIVFSGQTFGYLQPCGCSRPQMGGLERRAVFIERLKAKGWPVAGVDLGDIYPEQVALAEQGRLKYLATMNALRDMGYLGVGIGKTEIAADLISLLGSYAYQKEQRPFTLAANAVGVRAGANGKDVVTPREQQFNAQKEGARPVVESIEVGKVGKVPVGVAGVVGKALQKENREEPWGDKTLDFPNAQGAIKGALEALGKYPDKPQLKVLIFQGPSGDAGLVAADFPQFDVILCRSSSDLPPLQPQTVAHKDGTKTLIVQVGHRGQHVGVIGAFKRSDGTFDLNYQLVPLGEEFVTPGTEEEALKSNKALQALEGYAKAVKGANLLPQYARTPHPAQIHARDLQPPVPLTYAGTDACRKCHAAEFQKWKQASHSHAMATLENAKRPGLRNFDGECVKCHSVGFDYQSGYVNEEKSKHLRDVGCESCHGPGSGHVAAPKNKDFLALMSPWKQADAKNLPDPAFMKKMAETPAAERGQIALAPAQQLLIRTVENMCMKCHDHEADPHFDLYTNWPKINHTGLVQAPKNPPVPAKK